MKRCSNSASGMSARLSSLLWRKSRAASAAHSCRWPVSRLYATVNRDSPVVCVWFLWYILTPVNQASALVTCWSYLLFQHLGATILSPCLILRSFWASPSCAASAAVTAAAVAAAAAAAAFSCVFCVSASAAASASTEEGGVLWSTNPFLKKILYRQSERFPTLQARDLLLVCAGLDICLH